MASTKKLNLKDKVKNGEIDLSMLDLDQVPVKEIAQIKKVFSLDLSSNRLECLPNNFIILTNIIKLDLSNNNLKELPENFGSLERLQYLDLYKNKLEHLPLSFHNLKNLKWLDLKDNPLLPAITNVAGPCLDSKQCQVCAKSIVQFYCDMNKKVKEMQEAAEIKRQKNLAYKAKLEEKKREKIQKQKNADKNLSKNVIDDTTSEMKTSNITLQNKIDSKTKMKYSSFFYNSFFCLLFIGIGLFIANSITKERVEYVEPTSWSKLRDFFKK